MFLTHVRVHHTTDTEVLNGRLGQKIGSPNWGVVLGTLIDQDMTGRSCALLLGVVNDKKHYKLNLYYLIGPFYLRANSGPTSSGVMTYFMVVCSSR